MSVDLLKLRQREDEGVRAVIDLKPAAKWAALEILISDLGLRFTQFDIGLEKLRAFVREEKEEH